MSADLDDFLNDSRQRAAEWLDYSDMDPDHWDDYALDAINDRAALLNIVDRLREELAESRAAYDAVSRSIGSYVRQYSRPDVGSIVVDSDGNEAVVLGYNHAGVALVGTSPGHIEDARRRADAKDGAA